MLLLTLTLTLLAVLALGFWVFAMAPGRRENQVFAAFTWLAALWVANDLSFWGFHGPDSDGTDWARNAFLISVGLQLAFLAFTWIFPRPRPIARGPLALIVASALGVGALIVWGPAVSNVGFQGGEFRLTMTPATFLVGGYVYALFGVARLLMVARRKQEAAADGDSRIGDQLGLVLLSPLVTGALTTSVIVVLPFFEIYTLLPYASLGILAGAVIHSYAALNLRFLKPASAFDDLRLFPVTAKLSLAVAVVWFATVILLVGVVQHQLGGSLQVQAWQQAWVYALVAASLPAMALILAAQRIVTRPLRRVSEAALAVAGGRTDVRVQLAQGAGRDEMSLLAEAFNQMVERLEQDLEAQREMAQTLLRTERLAVAGSMAAGVAHEVNNPLAAISSLVQSAHGSAESERTRELLGDALGHMERISNALRDLLDFARVPGQPTRQPCRVNDVVERTVRLLRYDKRFRQLEFTVALDPSLPLVLADGDQLQQVLMNVLINARDAVETRRAQGPDAPARIAVTTRVREGELELRVEDSGCGIAAEDRDRLFEPFFTTKPHGAGTGLGLAVCRDLLRGHDGRISLESELGQGTQVIVRLPIPKAEGEVS
jgi:signal transduction histidine kinase